MNEAKQEREMSHKSERIIAALLECINEAQKSGDWKVDGACDPAYYVDWAETHLREKGWTTNAITGDTWVKEA